jgi:hypothetical protein
MITLKEKQNFNEMSIRVISSRKDGLPFRIAIKSPDHFPPHAHIFDLRTGKTELGQFEISKTAPRKPEDIKDYRQGVTDDMRELIFGWANSPHKVFSKISNWEALYLDWLRNENF